MMLAKDLVHSTESNFELQHVMVQIFANKFSLKTGCAIRISEKDPKYQQ